MKEHQTPSRLGPVNLWLLSSFMAGFFILSPAAGTTSRTPQAEQAQPCSAETQAYLRKLENNGIAEIDGWIQTLQTQYGIDLDDVFRLRRGEHFDVYGESLWNKLGPEQRAAEVALCAQDRLKRGFEYLCVTSPSNRFAMRTFPILFNTVTVNEYNFWVASPSRQMGRVIHEATHKCGTNDVTEFRAGPPRNVGIVAWYSIADTYEYWAAERFCIPNRDCP